MYSMYKTMRNMFYITNALWKKLQCILEKIYILKIIKYYILKFENLGKAILRNKQHV